MRDFLSGRIEQVADEHGVDLVSTTCECSADINPESELDGVMAPGRPAAANPSQPH